MTQSIVEVVYKTKKDSVPDFSPKLTPQGKLSNLDKQWLTCVLNRQTILGEIEWKEWERSKTKSGRRKNKTKKNFLSDNFIVVDNLASNKKLCKSKSKNRKVSIDDINPLILDVWVEDIYEGKTTLGLLDWLDNYK